jgi:hypothetical protein
MPDSSFKWIDMNFLFTILICVTLLMWSSLWNITYV